MKTMATRVRSYSKINLGLAIGPPRADGFHDLTTLYQTLDLHDLVTVEAKLLPEAGDGAEPMSAEPDLRHPDAGVSTSHSRISLTTNHPQVPADSRNTAWKMVELALARMGVAAEVAIHIEKELPVQGGMGAGSANAAAALIGLERELGFTLSELARLELAAEVGSDVPLFLLGGAVLGTGRGERVLEMPDLPEIWCVVGVSTPRAFQEWDSLCREQGTENREQRTADDATPNSNGRLTSPAEPDRLEELSHVYASVFATHTSDTSGIVRNRQGSSSSETKQGRLEDRSKTSEQGGLQNDLAGNALLALVRTGIENDFEQVVFPQYPLLREIKHELMGTSADGTSIGLTTDPARPDGSKGKALYAALSGSGSALFGLYGSEQDARAAQQRVQATGCKALLTKTLPRAEYWRRMFAE
jgi:4-diphosphocytidyl-2-C-methyl-D-erythritol kinase